MTRRLLAIWTLVCLAMGVLYIPPSPYLVCRMSGLVMAPVPETKTGDGQRCCQVKSSQGRIVLARPGCCDLVEASKRHLSPATVTSHDDAVPVVLPLTDADFYPRLVFVVQSLVPTADAPARAPPQVRHPARAPPFS